MFKKAMVLVLVLVLSMTLLFGCAGEKDENVLVVGTSADYPPYEFHVVVDGKDTIVGFEMEMIRWIAEEIGMEIEIVDMDFNGLLAAVDSGVVDCCVAAMSVNAERLEAVDFTDFYYEGVQLMLIRAEDADKYTTFESLDGAVCGIQDGTIHESLAIENIPNVQIKAYKTIPDMIMELQNGVVDCLCLDGYVAKAYAVKYPELLVPEAMTFPTSEDDSYAIAVKKGNTELVDKLNDGIAAMISSGKLADWILEANDQMLEESAG